MGGLFSKPKTPAPDPAIAEAQKKQEERLAKQEAEQKRQIASRARARRTGGLRLLMSPDRQDGESTKLGGGQ